MTKLITYGLTQCRSDAVQSRLQAENAPAIHSGIMHVLPIFPPASKPAAGHMSQGEKHGSFGSNAGLLFTGTHAHAGSTMQSQKDCRMMERKKRDKRSRGMKAGSPSSH